MGRSPPIVFIARHGARLDAADKDWHLTSPTPYDPPLSYGGWLQSRALGVRIASLLRHRGFTGQDPEGERSRPPTSDSQSTPNPSPAPSDLSHQYNIVIHTSPYLRCLQTAIAVSSGIKQHRPGTETPEKASPTPVGPADAGAPDPRCLLRVDAFLGEWLSPDYFDQITPPPASDRMLASAKAELLRRSDVVFAGDGSGKSSSGHFPGGWGSQSYPTSPTIEEEDRCLHSLGLSAQQGSRQRASTYDNPEGSTQTTRTKKILGRLDTNLPSSVDAAYVPPAPNYAVSASDPIPAGYVAHARNACTKIDYQWDSMRKPYWGTGGDYGDEWSTMHERVETGFRRMVEWYHKHDRLASTQHESKPNGASTNRDAETVLIIITHGADCNALISSLSGRAVLLDIGTSSLTMAVRRDRVHDASLGEDCSRLSSEQQDNWSVAQEYTLRLVASTDHLRAGANPSQLSSLSSPSAPQPFSHPQISTHRNRLGPRPSLAQGSFIIGPTSGSGSSTRGWTLAMRPSTLAKGTSGLWGSNPSSSDKADDTEDDFVPNFGDSRPASQDSPHPDRADDLWSKQVPQRTQSQRGLWGSAKSWDRDGSKRRWSVAEQKL